MSGKKHHIIPQLHLKHFTGLDPKGHVWTYDALSSDPPRSALPENTAVESHFYSIEMEDGTMNPLMDDYITDVEGRAAPVYRHILDGKVPVKGQTKGDFSTFLAVMYFRTPTMRRIAAEMIGRGIQLHNYAHAKNAEAFKSGIQGFEEKTGEKLDDKTKERIRQNMLDPSAYTLAIPKERTLIAMEGVDKLAKILFEMKWSVGEAQHGFFITSDNPVMRRIKRGTEHPFYGDGGFTNKSAQVTFPLSSKRLLLLTWELSVNEVFQIPREYLREENEARAAQSERHIYSHIKHGDLIRLSRQYKDVRPSITSSGFGPEKFSKVKVPRRWNKD